MEKSISRETSSDICERTLTGLINQEMENQEETNYMNDHYFNPEMELFVLGGHGDQEMNFEILGSCSSLSLCEEVNNTSTASLSSVNVPAQSKRQSKIPKRNEDAKKGKNVTRVKTRTPRNVLQKMSSTVLHQVASTENAAALQNFNPEDESQIANLSRQMEDLQENLNAKEKAILAKKDEEISNLEKLNSEQKLEIGNLTRQLKQFEKKLIASSEKSKELAWFEAEVAKNIKSNKLMVEKEGNMAKEIEKLEMKLKNAEERTRTLIERDKTAKEENDAESEKIRKLNTELEEATNKLKKAEAELETRRQEDDKLKELNKKKYHEKLTKRVKEEQAQLQQKYDDLRLWEDDMKQREETFKRDSSIKELRDTLIKILKKREHRNE